MGTVQAVSWLEQYNTLKQINRIGKSKGFTKITKKCLKVKICLNTEVGWCDRMRKTVIRLEVVKM